MQVTKDMTIGELLMMGQKRRRNPDAERHALCRLPFRCW